MKKLFLILLMLGGLEYVSAQDSTVMKPIYRTDFTGHPFLMLNGDSLYLESLNGKYILIDVWSPMCGICLREYPGLYERMTHYPQVQLISLCACPSVEVWKNTIEKRNFRGMHVIESTASEFLKEVGIRGVPRLILLDKKGKVLNASLPLPSKPEFKAELEKCLKE